MGGIHRADRFTGGVVAMLAKHGQKSYFFHLFGFMKPFDTEPAHFAPFQHPVDADNADIVFGITRGGACAAADASVQIHHHAPTIILVVMGRIKIPFGIVAFR